MTKASRWAWIVSMVAVTGAGLVLSFLLSIATNNPALYERHYVWLFWLNVTVATLLVARHRHGGGAAAACACGAASSAAGCCSSWRRSSRWSAWCRAC